MVIGRATFARAISVTAQAKGDRSFTKRKFQIFYLSYECKIQQWFWLTARARPALPPRPAQIGGRLEDSEGATVMLLRIGHDVLVNRDSRLSETSSGYAVPRNSTQGIVCLIMLHALWNQQWLCCASGQHTRYSVCVNASCSMKPAVAMLCLGTAHKI